MTYTVVLRAEPGGGYVALVPALPEVVGYGQTPEEAKRVAASVLRGRLSDRAEQGEPPPPDVDVTTLDPEAIGEDEYEAMVDQGLLQVTRERMAAGGKKVPLSEAKARLGL